MCLLVGCGRCVCLDSGVLNCVVDFPVLLGEVGMFELCLVVVGVMCPGCFFCCRGVFVMF